MQAKGEALFDKRTVKRNISPGLTTDKEHQEFIDSLEDCAEHAVECETRFVSTNDRFEEERAEPDEA
jgi:hypothetical protein